MRQGPRSWLAILLLSAAATGGARAAGQLPLGKLPDAAQPVAYRLDLTVLPDQQTFSGHAEIDIVLKAAKRSLYIHGRGLTMRAATVASAGRTTPLTYTEVDPTGVARLDFAQQLPAGRATLSFDYDAPFGNGPAGLYHTRVDGDWYAWSQFESIEARSAFPSFDEPGFKTPFTVSLTTRPGLLALSNAPEAGSPVPVGDLVRHRFAPTLPLPTYLVAFVVGPFITAEGVAPPNAVRNRPLPLRIVATRNHAGKLDYALRETPRIIELLEEYFGQPFPFPKLDQIGSPLMPGAMENAGADIYGDNILLLADADPTDLKQEFGMVVAHELSHQWFGDLVTPAWWDDIWLNESFANWMGYRIGNEWRPELNIGVGGLDDALDAMTTDSLVAGRPIRQPILTNSQIDGGFDTITYGKGGQIIAMIASYLGDEKFRAGVQLHMRRHLYGNATSDDFFKALADAAGDQRVLASLRSFVDQQGVPMVTLVPDDGGYRATQARYTRLGSRAPQQQWVIPLCVRRGADTTCTLLDQKSGDIRPRGDGALVPNARGTGYYLYELQPADWDALIAQAARLPANEALVAEASLAAQFEAGRLPAARLIAAARAFAAHADSLVAPAATQALQEYARRGVVPSAALPDYRQLMRAIYGPKLAALGFDPHAGAHLADSPDRQNLRQAVVYLLAIEARDPALRRRLAAAATARLAGAVAALDPAFYGAAFRVLVEDGDLATTRALFAQMLVTRDELLRASMVRALGTSGRPADARWLTAQLQDARLRPNDRARILAALLAAPATRELGYPALVGQFTELSRQMGLFGTRMLPQLPAVFCSESMAQRIDADLRHEVVAAGRGTLHFERSLESVRSCAVLQQARSAELAAALRQAAQQR